MKAKSKFQDVGGAFAQAVARGEAELGIGVTSNIIAVPGTDFAGALPTEIQNYVSFVGGVSIRAANSDGAKAFVKFLASTPAVAVLKQNGIDPVTQ